MSALPVLLTAQILRLFLSLTATSAWYDSAVARDSNTRQYLEKCDFEIRQWNIELLNMFTGTIRRAYFLITSLSEGVPTLKWKKLTSIDAEVIPDVPRRNFEQLC